MTRSRITLTIGVLSLAALALVAVGVARGQGGHDHHARSDAGERKGDAAASSGSRRVTMDELHRQGGVPRGWKFTLPSGGDPAKGRELFAELECYKCHAIQDAGFPPSGGDGKTGPELTGMGRHHPAEYFAESIIAPDHVLLDGPGYIGPDGRSIMPSYADSLSVTQLLDLVAFVRSQDGGAHEHHGSDGAPQERTVGPYRVRLVFKDHAHHHASGGQGVQTSGGHGAHHAADKPGATRGHLMAFVTDTTTGEPVPYLPVTAGVQVQGAPTRTVKLAPMVGDSGFHYGADVTLPSGTQRVVLTIGSSTLRIMGADRARFSRPQTVAFDWGAAAR